MYERSEQGRTATISSTIVTFLACISVALRFYTRRMVKAGIKADDWWILTGLLSMLGTSGLLLYGIRSDPEGGEMIDRDSPTFDYAPHTTYLKVSFTAATLYFSVVTAIKISILLMYRRIFPIDSFRWQSLLVGVFVILWWIIGTVLVIVSCTPIDRLWIGPSAGGYCFDFNLFWMAMGGIELVVDSFILVLPVRMVLGLRMSAQQKILVASIFLLGGFVIVTGLLRVILGYRPGSQNVAFPKAELWSSVHIDIAIVCACLPTLRPLITQAAATVSSMRCRYSSSVLASDRDNCSGDNDSGSSNVGSKKGGGVEVLPLESMRSGN